MPTGTGFPLKKRINRYTAESFSVLPYSLFFAVCAAIAWVLVGDAQNGPLVAFLPQADYWELVAVLREWLQQPVSPGNPQVNDPVLSARFMPWFWLLTMIGRALQLSPTQLLSVSALAGFIAVAVGMLLFMREYFRNAWAPFLGMLVVFGFWGTGGDGVGVFQLKNFIYVAAYPSSLVFGCSLISFWMTMRLLHSERTLPLWAISLALLTSLMFLTHPLTGVFGITGCMLLAFTETTSSNIRRLVALVMLVAAVALAELWPYFSMWELAVAVYGSGIGVPGPPTAALYSPAVVGTTLGLSLLGLPVVIYLLQSDRRPFIAYGALLMLAPYAFNLVFDVPLAERFLFFAAIYFQFALVWVWLNLIGSVRSLPRPVFAVPALLISMIFGAVVLVANVWMMQDEVKAHRQVAEAMSNASNNEATQKVSAAAGSVSDVYGELLAPVTDDAVVLAMPETGWPVAAHKGRVVSLYKDNPMLGDQEERLQATRDFFLEPTEDLDRVATIQQYAVSHVLLDAADEELHADVRPWLDSYSRLVAEHGSLRMYQLAEALHQVKLPEPAAPRMVEAAFAARKSAKKPARRAQAEKPARQAVAKDLPRETRPTESKEDTRTFGAPISKPLFEDAPSGG